MAKRNMEKDTTIINARNELMTKLLILFFIIAFIVKLFFDPEILMIIGPVGIIFCGLSFYLARRKTAPYLTIYIILTCMYLFFFILTNLEPIPANFIFLWQGLILSAIYYKRGPILYASVLTLLLTLYFFFTYRESILSMFGTVDVVYIILFTVFITIFLIFTSAFTENLRIKAERGEEAATKELFAVRGYLDSLFYHMTDAVAIHDFKGNVLQVNKSFRDIYEWEAKEILGKQLPYLNDGQFQYIRNLWEEVKRNGEGIEQIQMKHSTKSGKVIDVAISISPIRNKEGNVTALATFSKDISEKIQTEEIIRRSEKLSVVGQLAAGVAHEIRNPLTVISGFLQLHQDKKDNTHYPLMLSEINRINQIISEFLVLAKPQLDHFVEVEICSLVDEVTTLINTSAIMKSITIKTHYRDQSLKIFCEPNQIKQVLINLLKNSIEAMDQGGTVNVTIAKNNKSDLEIRITDDGVGISNKELSKLGEPFFTTKEKGTGLGLMISFKIIENHKGKMTFSSTEGEGTTVEIILPGLK